MDGGEEKSIHGAVDATWCRVVVCRCCLTSVCMAAWESGGSGAAQVAVAAGGVIASGRGDGGSRGGFKGVERCGLLMWMVVKGCGWWCGSGMAEESDGRWR